MAVSQVYCVHMKISALNSVLIGFRSRKEALSIAKKIYSNTESYRASLKAVELETGRSGQEYILRSSKIMQVHIKVEDKIRENPIYVKDPVDRRNFYRGKSLRQADLMYRDPSYEHPLIIVNEQAVESVFYTACITR